jgi:hypothetical protein
MKMIACLVSCALLVGCQATPDRATELASVLVAVPTGTVPTDSEAIRLLGEFEAAMARSIPIADRVAVMVLRDRLVRDVFAKVISDPSLSDVTREQFEQAGGALMTRIDTENTRELKELMATRFEITDVAKSSPELFGQIFHIIQHSPDAKFRSDVLTSIEPLALAGDVEGQLYATMFDRVQIANGKKQRYGTQVKCISGKYDVFDLEDPVTVDQLRAALRMDTLAVSVARNQALYGTC